MHFRHVVVIVCFFMVWVHASPGDRDPAYRTCVHECYQSVCAHPDSPPPPPLMGKSRFQPLPRYLQWLFWTCEDNCRYQCMHEIVGHTLRIHRAMDRAEKKRNRRPQQTENDDETEEEGDALDEGARRIELPTTRPPIYQYHGKWPFIRVFGLQELFSVLFSIGNAAAHVAGYRALKRQFIDRHPNYYLSPLLKCYFVISLVMWMASAIFHARDTPLTEKLDYCLAMVSLFFTLYLSWVRMFKLQSPASRHTLGGLFLLLGLYHVNYLVFHSFDYRWNMLVGIGLITTFNIGWTLWYLLQRQRAPATRYYTWKVQAFVAFFSLAAALEILDFPPWALLVDAHSLWHACTMPLILLWYRFLLDDSLYEATHHAYIEKVAA